MGVGEGLSDEMGAGQEPNRSEGEGLPCRRSSEHDVFEVTRCVQGETRKPVQRERSRGWK